MIILIAIIVVWLLIVGGAFIKVGSDLHNDANAPATPDYNKTGWDFHEELKQRAKWNTYTEDGGDKKRGKYWLSGKDPYLIIEKEVSGGRISGIDIPYENISSYNPYKYEHGVNKNIIGTTLAGGIIAGPIGGIIGAIMGSGQNNLIDSLGVIVTTKDGERYDLNMITGPYKPDRDDIYIKKYAKTLRRLDEIVNGRIN